MKRLILASVLVFGCAGQQPVRPSIAALDRMMSSPAAREVARDAPDAFAEASTAVQHAREAATDAERDDLSAEARLVFERAEAVADAARARRRVEESERQRVEIDADVARAEQESHDIEAEVTRMIEARRATARARQAATAPNGVAAPERRNAAAELRQQAELFVAAAVMLGAEAPRVAEVRQRIEAAEHASNAPDASQTLSAAGAAYASAERLLQGARDAHPAEGGTDGAALQASLSEAGGLDPRRDARGVIAVLRGLFAGPRLAPTSRTRVETLARVLAAHRDARVRVEVYVGGPQRAPAETLATAQATALADALRHAGIAPERLQSQGLHAIETGGTRDDRVEVVLVLPSAP